MHWLETNKPSLHKTQGDSLRNPEQPEERHRAEHRSEQQVRVLHKLASLSTGHMVEQRRWPQRWKRCDLASKRA